MSKELSEKLSAGFKTIEDGVVGGYKKIETGVVSGYTKIEDTFIGQFLTKEGETVEEAKIRLKKEQEQMRNNRPTK